MMITELYIISGLFFFSWGLTAENLTYGIEAEKYLPQCGIIHCDMNLNSYGPLSDFSKEFNSSKFASVSTYMMFLYNETNATICYVGFEELIMDIKMPFFITISLHENLKHIIFDPPKVARYDNRFEVIDLVIHVSGQSMSGLEKWVNVIKPYSLMFDIDFTSATTSTFKYVWKLISSQTGSFRMGNDKCERNLHLPNSFVFETSITDRNTQSKSINSVEMLQLKSKTKETGQVYSLINEFTWLDVISITYNNISFSVNEFQKTLRKMPEINHIHWNIVSIG